MPSRPRLLRAGDLVRFDGRLHTVAALDGTAVRLVDEGQSASVVMLAHLLSSGGFQVVTPALVRTVVPPAGVLEGLSAKAVERAEWWQRHLVRGTSRTWLGKTIAASATHIEALLAEPKTSGRASPPRQPN